MKNKEIEIEIYFPVNKRIASKSMIIKEGTTLKEFLNEIKFKNFDLMDDISFGVSVFHCITIEVLTILMYHCLH